MSKLSRGNGQKIIESNRKILYRIPKRYKYISKALKHKGIRELIFKLYKDIYDGFFIYKHKYIFFKDTGHINKIRGKKTGKVSNHYINYLCCMGLINKQFQHLDRNGLVEETELTEINKAFLLNNPDMLPINHFYFKEYARGKELDRIEERTKRLIENDVTPGNVSYLKLIENNCADIANEVFYNNIKGSEKKKQQELEMLKTLIDKRLEEQGYTTKQDIYNNLSLPAAEIDKLFTIYKKDLWQRYRYKPPDKAEKERFNLSKNFKKWIIKEASHE